MGREATDVTATWGAPLIAIHCSQCGEAHLVKDVPPRCPFCLAESVESQPAYLPEEPPEQTVDYQITDAGLCATLGRWTKGVWFCPDDMTADIMAQRAQRYLVPLWLVDGQVQASWRADVGFDYQVVSSQDRYLQGGGWASREVKELRVRWEPRVGRLERQYENLSAPALDDHRKLMRRLGRYNISQRAAYTPDAVSDAQATGAVAVRIPTLEPEAAWSDAETAFAQAAQAECQQAAGADHIRDFTIDARYSGLNWTLLLLPAYVTWYEEGGQVWPVLINGQIGHVSPNTGMIAYNYFSPEVRIAIIHYVRTFGKFPEITEDEVYNKLENAYRLSLPTVEPNHIPIKLAISKLVDEEGKLLNFRDLVLDQNYMEGFEIIKKYSSNINSTITTFFINYAQNLNLSDHTKMVE